MQFELECQDCILCFPSTDQTHFNQTHIPASSSWFWLTTPSSMCDLPKQGPRQVHELCVRVAMYLAVSLDTINHEQ